MVILWKGPQARSYSTWVSTMKMHASLLEVYKEKPIGHSHQEAVGSANGIFIKLYRPEFFLGWAATMVWRSHLDKLWGALYHARFWNHPKGFCRTAVIPRDEKNRKRPQDTQEREGQRRNGGKPRALSGRSCTPAMWPWLTRPLGVS